LLKPKRKLKLLFTEQGPSNTKNQNKDAEQKDGFIRPQWKENSLLALPYW